MLIGVISDTHGLLREGVRQVLKDVDVIIHAGDIGDSDILLELEKIAPLIAVRGNCDKGEWANSLPPTNLYDTGSNLIYIIHDLARLDITPEITGVSIVVYGHSHVPKAEKKGDVLYINPGSVGPQRFNLPISAALIEIVEKDVRYHFIDIDSI